VDEDGVERLRKLRIDSRGGKVDSRMMALVEAAQPYLRVDDPTEHPLWLVREMSNIDKHRLLITATIAAAEVEFTYGWATFGGDFQATPLVPGAYIGRWPSPGKIVTAGIPAKYYDPRVKVNLNISPHISFNEGEPGARQEVSTLLQLLAKHVGGVVDSFRAFF
jgi:hypothetical protein